MPPQPRQSRYDAIVVGSGPNGLAAAITLARAGLEVLVAERAPEPGGSTRTAEVTLPGFRHDLCSAIHPMGLASPFLRTLPLGRFGLEWRHPDVLVSHPLDGGRGAAIRRDVDETAASLGIDGPAWSRLFQPLVDRADDLLREILGPLPVPPHHPVLLTRFGLRAMRPAFSLARSIWKSDEARALFAGNAAHSIVPLERLFTSAIGLVLILAGHRSGWPVARGGSASITGAMIRYLEALGGEVVCGMEVRDIADLPQARVVLFDTGPHALAEMAARRLPERYRARLRRFRYGPGVFKLDLALSDPVPWTHAPSRAAGTVHVGGTLEEIAESERACWEGRIAARPFVLVGQQSLADDSRAPAGRHTLWAYCHVPHGSTEDFTEAILSQIERFAPGFRDTILATHRTAPAAIAAANRNCVGGDITGGVTDIRQLFTRPVARWNPYTTPDPGIFLCSSSTPPGAGVHGMCGWHAARTALEKVFGIRTSLDEFPPADGP